MLGFEYGFSLADPKALVLWEAQFGDFANGAQVIIDQFISLRRIQVAAHVAAWSCCCRTATRGRGRSISSARLERYLQLCAEDNMQVVNCTTPANYFHALRRQMHRNFRKPLIVMTPKSLLRHKLAVSTLAEMGPGTSFHRILWDERQDRAGQGHPAASCCAAARSITTSMRSARSARSGRRASCASSSSIRSRHKPLKTELARFPGAEIVWCQEEPKNMGAWTTVLPEIEAVMADMGLKQQRLRYVGRPAAASPATGLLRRHLKEQAALVERRAGRLTRPRPTCSARRGAIGERRWRHPLLCRASANR